MRYDIIPIQNINVRAAKGESFSENYSNAFWRNLCRVVD